jgi:acyl-CoA synthetase (AMP-forming)/AMP-acid ligase II
MGSADFSSVEFVRMGSAPVSESLMRALKRTIPKAAVTNAYGTTEGGPAVFGPHPKGLPQPEMSVGYPIEGVQVRLVGENATQGVLEMKAPSIMNGYHNRPDLPSPIKPDGFYVTGDVFRRDENGFHTFVGRTDDMFVSGGENIYPSDVERMLERHRYRAGGGGADPGRIRARSPWPSSSPKRRPTDRSQSSNSR